MKVEESTPDKKRMDLISAVALDAAKLLGVSLEDDSSQSIIDKVNETVTSLALGKNTVVSGDENPDLLLGALWGAQMKRQFSWYWADVVLDDSINEVAMISPNQEMIIFPFSFVGACLNKQCICTLLLAFNMLLENDRICEIPPKTYENIMLSIHHIVPPYSLG
ncbi:hypothetical protein BVX99_01755 [bacterium F16]|nr:hypothetical protein BVX99_01755 [bacterium F16]